MKLRSLTTLAAALALGGTTLAKGPVKATKVTKAPKVTEVSQPSTAQSAALNQKLAEAVAARLSQSSVAEGADVALVTDDGAVTVTGGCMTAEQKKAILGEIRVVTGVKLVRDGLTVGGVQQAQALGPVAGVPPTSVMPQATLGGAVGAPGYGGPLQEPLGLGQGGGYEGAAPPLPPYAWPTYAPHNNVSRVGYPESYPYNAFPYIGPFYPFPKVPLGWRSVNLTWEDGHWFMGRTAVPHDYWRVRFW